MAQKTGDWVEQDEVLLELETDKATVEIVAESAGKLETLISEGEVVKVGDVIAKIDASAENSSENSHESKKETATSPAASSPQNKPKRSQQQITAQLLEGW